LLAKKKTARHMMCRAVLERSVLNGLHQHIRLGQVDVVMTQLLDHCLIDQSEESVLHRGLDRCPGFPPLDREFVEAAEGDQIVPGQHVTRSQVTDFPRREPAR
jgi:predicted RNA methylase